MAETTEERGVVGESSTATNRRARRSSRRNDRGAVLVEAAIAIPMLLFLIFGAIELGMAWEARSSSTSGVRTGLLRAASLGDAPETDLRVLQSVIGEIGSDNVDDIAWIVIFDANTANAEGTIASCAAAAGASGGRGFADLCNAYDTNDLINVVGNDAETAISIADFDDGTNVSGTDYTCDPTKIDSKFCAGDRLTDGAINVGVAVQYHHEWLTGLLPGDGNTFTEYSISSTLVGEQAASVVTAPHATTSTTTPPPTSSTSSTTTTTTTTTTTIPLESSFSPTGSPTKVGANIDTGSCCGVDEYIQFNTGNNDSGPVSEPRIDLNFTVDEDTNYSLELIAYTWPNSWTVDYNEVWIVIDGDLANPILFEWDNSVVGFNAASSPSFFLAAGAHTISIHNKEGSAPFSVDDPSLNKV